MPGRASLHNPRLQDQSQQAHCMSTSPRFPCTTWWISRRRPCRHDLGRRAPCARRGATTLRWPETHSMFAPAYLDHNATTPLDARVLEAMLPFLHGTLRQRFEPPRVRPCGARRHRRGATAGGGGGGAHPTEVVFHQRQLEANNLFIKGAAAASNPATPLRSPAIEHPACERYGRPEAVRLGPA